MKFLTLPLALVLIFTACGTEKDSDQPKKDDAVAVPNYPWGYGRFPKLPRPPKPVPPAPMPVPIPIPQPTPIPDDPQNPGYPAQTVWQALHNDLRIKHGAPLVTEPFALTMEAQAWADRCVFQHAQGTGHGENLAIGRDLTAYRAMQLWYDEGKNYPYGAATPPMSYMHFTQVIWKNTTEIGCASKVCPQGTLYVCRYNPPGNYIGQFAGNVLPIK